MKSAVKINYYAKPILTLCFVTLAGCGAQSSSYLSLGNSLLNSAGYGSSGGSMDVNSLLKAGTQLSEATRGLDEQQEYYLGRGISAEILTRYKLSKNGAQTRYVNKVGQTLARYSDRPEIWGGYRFAVLDTEEINAFSTPGGFVFISRGFLKIIPNEDALAGVLAHEVGHIVKGHGTAAISQANITQALTTVGKEVANSQGGEVTQLVTTAFGDSIKDVTDTLLTKGYSRSQEYEADEYAAELMTKAGYNNTGLVTMLKSLEKLEASNPSGGWYSTHPAPERRESNVDSEIVTASAAQVSGEKVRTSRYLASR